MFIAEISEDQGSRNAGYEAALGALINIVGRQRMLSHRAVMLLALSQAADVVDRDLLLEQADQAISAYVAGVHRLLGGDSDQGIPPVSSTRVRRLLSEPTLQRTTGERTLEAFGVESRACLEILREGQPRCGPRIRTLADTAGDVLLPLLNAIVSALEEDLADAMRQEAERAADVRAVMTGALDDIEQTATKIRLIAFNALIEAARAGDAGRAFSVIAEEIKNLGAQTRAESARMQAAIARLFAA